MALRSKHSNGANIKDTSSTTSPIYNHNNTASNMSMTNIYSLKKRSCSRKVEKSGGSVIGLLEAMKNSSPPRVRCNLELETIFDYNTLCADTTIDEMQQYRAWMVKINSLFTPFLIICGFSSIVI
jgi:hypothetical protein